MSSICSPYLYGIFMLCVILFNNPLNLYSEEDIEKPLSIENIDLDELIELQKRVHILHECLAEFRQLKNIKFFKLTEKQRKNYTEKMSYHEKEGQRCFRESEKMCTLIPDIDLKEISIYLFSQAIFLSINQSFSGAINLLEANLITYGVYQFNQWKKMQTLLHESKAHFDMRDFYKELLEKA